MTSIPSRKITLQVPLQPKQIQLLDLVERSLATWIGYGGARGGAKSHAARAVVLLQALQHPDTRCCILRRTYELVRENHIEPLLSQYPFLRDYYRVGDKELILPNRSVIAFRYAENPGDVDAIIGKQYRWFAVDQAEAFTERELNVMKSCARWPGAVSKFILTFNPGNVGHSFLKRVFFDRQYRAGEHAEDYVFLQAFGWDNVEWARTSLAHDGLTEVDYYSWDSDRRFRYFIERTQYGRELNALPQAMRIGWLLGRMDQFAGQYYDIFSPERHVVRCHPEPWHTLWLGIDWGFAHDSVAHWCSQIKPKLTAFYREWSGKGLAPSALAQQISSLTPPDERPRIRHIFLSHDAFAKTDERDTIAQQMGVVFRQNGMPEPEMASKDVAGRATLLYSMMGPPDPVTKQLPEPEVVIDPSCRRLIDVIPMICRDQTHSEKTVKFDGDDAFDSAVYALTYRLKSKGPPAEVTVMEQANTIADPVARWFFLRKNYPKKKDVILTPQVVLPWQQEGPYGVA